MERRTRDDDYFFKHWWNLVLRFYEMYGWRVVDGRDDDGVIVRYLMIPMKYNGIQLNKQGLPFMTLDVVPREKGVRDMFDFSHLLIPHIPRNVHDELVDRGMLCPTEHYWAQPLGGMRRYKTVAQKAETLREKQRRKERRRR